MEYLDVCVKVNEFLSDKEYAKAEKYLVRVLQLDWPAFERHLINSQLIEMLWGRREDPLILARCVEACWEDIKHLREALQEWKLDNPDQSWPEVNSLAKLIQIYDEQEWYDKAIELCQVALNLKLTDDGTSTGYNVRMAELLEKKKALESR